MAKLDPRLRLLLEACQDDPALGTAGAAAVPLGTRLGWEQSPQGATIDVLVEARPGVLDGSAENMSPAAVGSVRVGRVTLASLSAMADDPSVNRIEASRPMFAELNVSRVDCRADPVHGAAAPVRGAGVAVAVIDSGIDYTHPAFRRADGGSRILRIWDQAAAGPATSVPFGREYTRDDLDAALATADPHAAVPHRDRSGHGTHVAGIAAGSEVREGLFTGIAPDAELIVVALKAGTGGTLGRSAELVSALEYVVDRARGRPVAVNISQGMNGGGHAGETLVERKIDELANARGVVVVKSAGNEQEWDVHAGGTLAAGEQRALTFQVRATNRDDDVIEVWFGGGDDITVAVAPPSGPASPPARLGDLVRFDTATGNLVRIEVDDDADDTGDRRATVILRRGSVPELEPGDWEIRLSAESIADGRYDAWIERAARSTPGAPEQSRFVAGSVDPTRTVTIPGTARRVVTVASYVTKPAGPFNASIPGRLSTFSSRGPTRLGAEKPELTAPGEFIMSARADDGSAPEHALLAGTSMAAPHVTGAAALLLELRPELTGWQVRQVLRRSARRDAAVAVGPASGWGRGKLDVAAAVEAARAATFPTLSSAQVQAGRLELRADRPASVEVRIHSDAARLAAGAALHTLTATAPATAHQIDLTVLVPGSYFAELVLTDAAGWATVDDADGAFHQLVVDEAAAPAAAGADDDLEQIDGIGRVCAARLMTAGIATFAGLAGTTVDELAQITGRRVERILSEDWIGQAKGLVAGSTETEEATPPARDRRPFTLAALIERRTGRLVGWEATDARSGDRTTALDTDALVAFLLDKVGGTAREPSM